jgi:Arc/MetJ-type ribon-helix-helix transcriptional regulator
MTKMNLFVHQHWLDAIDQWRRKQPILVNRSEAIRTLVQQSLDRSTKKAARASLREPPSASGSWGHPR